MEKSKVFLFLVKNILSVILCYLQIGLISGYLAHEISRLSNPLLGDELCVLQGSLEFPEGSSFTK